jgi:blocked-early-in-transport protein 1
LTPKEGEERSPLSSIEANRTQLTIAIGDEIRDTAHMTDLENSFEGTRVRLRGNMKRMLRMAEKTGVGWRVWLGFICAVFLLFFYVWIF